MHLREASQLVCNGLTCWALSCATLSLWEPHSPFVLFLRTYTSEFRELGSSCPWSLLCKSSIQVSYNFLKMFGRFKKCSLHTGATIGLLSWPLYVRRWQMSPHPITKAFLSAKWKCPCGTERRPSNPHITPARGPDNGRVKSPETHPCSVLYGRDVALPYCDFHFTLDGSSYILARLAHLPLCLKMRYLFASFFMGFWGNASQNKVKDH